MHNREPELPLPSFARNIRVSSRMSRTGRPGLMPAYPLTCIRFSPGLYLICKDFETKEQERDHLYGSGVAFDLPSFPVPRPRDASTGRTDRQKRESVKYRDSNLTGTYWACRPGYTGRIPRRVGPSDLRLLLVTDQRKREKDRHGFPYIPIAAPKRGRFRHLIMKFECEQNQRILTMYLRTRLDYLMLCVSCFF